MRQLILLSVFFIFSFCAFSQESNSQNEQCYYAVEQTSRELLGTDSLFSESQKIAFFIVLGVLLIAFIIAHVKARRSTMVVIAGWKDVTLLATPIILGLLILLAFLILGYVDAVEDRAEFLTDRIVNNILIFWLVASAVSLIISFVLSIIANRNNAFNIIISILAKVFVFSILIFLILGVLDYHLRENKKDRRFRDGTRGNNKTKWYLFIFAIASMLLIPLVKTNSTLFEEQHEKLKNRNVW